MKRWIGALLERPVGVVAVVILLVCWAFAAALHLPIALLPPLAYPSLVVWTAYPDMPPVRVEQELTEPIEEALAGIDGLTRLSSRSQLGGSLVRTDFGWNTDLELAALDVRRQLDRLFGSLPDRADRPLVLRVDPSERPILVMALGLETLEPGVEAGPLVSQERLLELKRLARDVVARRLEQIDGVARVKVTGGYERHIEVLVDADRLDAYGIDPGQIADALRAANISLGGGAVRRGPFRYAVEVSGEFRTPADIAMTLVSAPRQPPVYLHQVADLHDGVATRRGLVRLDGHEVLLLLVERRSDANTVQVAREVRQALANQRIELPDLRCEVLIDESVFVEEAIAGVLQAVLVGGFLAIAVLFFFLRRPHSLAAIATAVPMSLAITLVLFELFDVSLNLIALSGLALGVGMLVDNAIVVVENIYRLREHGYGAKEAAARGAAEVAPAITASTLTTMAVFLPLSLVEGLAGRLFRDQSLAVVCSLAASLLVAFTVVPLIVSRERRGPMAVTSAQQTWLRRYEHGLEGCWRHSGPVLAGALIFLVTVAALAWRLPREAVPDTEVGHVEVEIQLPADAGPDLMSERALALEAEIATWPEVRHVLADVGEQDQARLDLTPRPPYRADLTLILTPGASLPSVVHRLPQLRLAEDTTLKARPARNRLESLLEVEQADLWIDLIGERRETANAAASRLLAELEHRPQLHNVARAHPEGLPAYRLRLGRDQMLRFGASPKAIRTTIEAATGGLEATRLRTVNDATPVVVHSRQVESIDQLLARNIPTHAGLLPLARFLEAEPLQIPAVLMRHRQTPVVRVLADISPQADLKSAVQAVEDAFTTVSPLSVRGRISGVNDVFQAGLKAVADSLLLSLILVYLILAAKFESLIHPLVILATVPFALAGVVLALTLATQSWNLMSLAGCVALVGIAVNDAILKVDLIDRRRRQGLPLQDALRHAGRDRLRPVLMTTLSTACGLLPLACGVGAGARIHAPLAVAIIGGLLGATVYTLILVPVIYGKVLRDGKRVSTNSAAMAAGAQDGRPASIPA